MLAIVGFVNNRPLRVDVAVVERDVTVRVFGLGTIEARVMSKIGFEVGATLVELNADHGDRVVKGQVLARLSLGEQEAKVARAKASLEVAEANINRADANLEKARAVLAQKQEANRRKQALMGREIVAPQAAEETARDEYDRQGGCDRRGSRDRQYQSATVRRTGATSVRGNAAETSNAGGAL